MKKWLVIFTALIALPARADAMSPVKLPYAKGQSFIVTQGYDAPPTHVKKDSYALDLTQNGCDAYGMPVVATASGTAMFVGQEGYNGGYGAEMIIDHGGGIVSRYAHMISGSITVATTGTPIRQGEEIGLVGDTGLVAGAACAEHPGTHLHFAMDAVNGDGTFSAYDPEPISGHTNVTEGSWYLSDNGEDDASASVDAAPAAQGDVLGAYVVATATVAAATSPPPSPPLFTGGGAPAIASVAVVNRQCHVNGHCHEHGGGNKHGGGHDHIARRDRHAVRTIGRRCAVHIQLV